MESDDQCLICFESLDKFNSVEFTLESDSRWLKSRFCIACIKDLQETQFQKYCDDLAGTTCAKEQRKLLERGPPVNIFDKHGFPESNGCEIFKIRRCSDMIEFSPKLSHSLEGKARLLLWKEQKNFLINDEPVSPKQD